MGVCNVISLQLCLLFSCVNAALLRERDFGGGRSMDVANLASAIQDEGTTANRTSEREAATTACPKSIFGNESCEDFAAEPGRSVALKSSNDSGPLLGSWFGIDPVSGEAAKKLDSTDHSFVPREEKTFSQMTSSSTVSTSDASNRFASFGSTVSTSDAPDASNRSSSFGSTVSTSDAPAASNRSSSFGSTVSTSDAPDASNRSSSFDSTATDSVVAEREDNLFTSKAEDASVETTTPSRASSIVSCPSIGFCPLRWLMARDQCIDHNNCSHVEMCCRIWCSKICIKIPTS